MNWKQPKVYAVKHKDEATRVANPHIPCRILRPVS